MTDKEVNPMKILAEDHVLLQVLFEKIKILESKVHDLESRPSKEGFYYDAEY